MILKYKSGCLAIFIQQPDFVLSDIKFCVQEIARCETETCVIFYYIQNFR